MLNLHLMNKQANQSTFAIEGLTACDHIPYGPVNRISCSEKFEGFTNDAIPN
jgi:hypothetical protein